MMNRKLSTFTRKLLAPALAVAAALVLMPAPAMAQGTDQPGDQITLTEQEAENWKLLPVHNAEGEQIGELAAVSLAEDGKISEIRVETGQELGLGGKTVTVQPDQFTSNGARVKLTMSNEQIEDLPTAK